MIFLSYLLMQGPVTIRSRTISHKVTNEASRKLKSSCHVRSVSQFAGTFPDQSINDLPTRKESENFGRLESDNVQLKTNKPLTDNIQISSTTADGAANMQHTDVSIIYRHTCNLFLTGISCRLWVSSDFYFV